MKILNLIEQCDQCKKTIQSKDLLIVGQGVKDIKLCPDCHYELWKKYILPNLDITKKNQSILHKDDINIKIYLNQYAKKFKEF